MRAGILAAPSSYRSRQARAYPAAGCGAQPSPTRLHATTCYIRSRPVAALKDRPNLPTRVSVRLSPALALAAALIAALTLAPAAGASPMPHDFVGMTAEDVFAGDATYRDANLAAQSADRASGSSGRLRLGERSRRPPGQYDLGSLRRLRRGRCQRTDHDPADPLQRAAVPRYRVAPARRLPAAGQRLDWRLSLGPLVRRYGPRGSLWRERPGAAASLPIRSWQIWNEPNLRVYWCNKPNASSTRRCCAPSARRSSRSIRGAPRSSPPGLPDEQDQRRGPAAAGSSSSCTGPARSATSTRSRSTRTRRDRRELGRLLGSVRSS